MGSRNLRRHTQEKNLEKYSEGVIYEFQNKTKRTERKRWLCLYAIKGQYSAGKEGVETDHLPGMRNLNKPTREKNLEKYSEGVIYERKNMAKKPERKRRIRLYAFKG